MTAPSELPRVYVECRPLAEVESPVSLVGAIADRLEWGLGRDVFWYEESLEHCLLEARSLQQCEPTSGAWEGRVFAADAEVRWVADPGGQVKAWLTREVDGSDDAHVEQAHRQERGYYLLGVYDGESRFVEARYGAKEFVLPVDTSALAPGARARIRVVEYYRAQPDWSKIADPEEVRRRLAEPRLVAHRFASIDAGDDTTRGDGR